MDTVKSDTSALKSDMDTVKSDISALKSDMATAKSDISTIQSTMATKADITRLENKIEQYGEVQQKDIYHLLQLTSKKVDNIHEDLKSLAEVTGEHEMKIRSLARRPV
jgi:chromosome segregation ATPase